MGDKKIPVYFNGHYDKLVGRATLNIDGSLSINITNEELARGIYDNILVGVSVQNIFSFEVKRRFTRQKHAACLERWPECESGEYNPACCRFPKSCSCEIIPERTNHGKVD